ncbi:Nucleolar pre-ribosomal-associated protein 1 N-terminal [Penicillium coprophilum]|uniref:Nucleolar pre-ribosomal-associated protein 1 N-terminal n=1 Tax=Penicillium coprophilum TaxID=36646 RepID=UPI0023954FB0|nr:Nucleolar pre-ribosomal-associated protein 1 N-terminal [Penicillium coprophilum]KAJ5177558.1 Nucleolar pre-ribosomal-associated protein 1 N-terminal [Penicillium coprophilum]
MSHVTEHPSRAKRRKLDDPKPEKTNVTSNIKSAASLRELLAVQQNAPLAKQGIIKFKEFLVSIAQTEEASAKAEKLRVLKQYCDKQITNSGKEDETSVCFADLIQSWSFGDSNNNEPLLTSVPSVLAIFLKTISSELEFREFGIALCKHLLQKDQLRLFNRGLTATKSKEHLISPCLRLLTEIVTFDGGAVARQLYLRRYITFKRLEVFLTPNKAQEISEDEFHKSTLRRNAQRYLLANLRVQHASEKDDIIEQHKITRSFLEYIRKDPRDTVLEIIKAIERDIVHDSALSRKSKSKFFNRHNLERLVTLYGYDRESDEPNAGGVVIANEIHRVMMNVCKTAGLGVLLPETGWYPAGSDPETLAVDDDTCIELGLDSPIYVDKYRDSVPVRNGSLSFLIQCLRPDVDSLQIELLVSIFKVAPELIADYFSRKTMFISDPKATPSWMAESAFLFSTVQLPVPANCGWKDKLPILPPPVSIVIENILPRPLNQKIMTRCLNQNAEIITLFAVRILTLAFTKLRAVLKIFQSDHGQGQLYWNQASAKLLAEFSRRCPAVKDVVVLFRRTDKEDLTQQEAVAELLTCYYEVMPDIALEENFDVSLVLVDVLKRLEAPDVSADDSESLLSQLQSILQIAQQSASLRWWQKPASMQYSPFTSILKVLMDTSDKDSSRRISTLLKTVLVENSVLQSSPHAFASVLSSLENSEADALHQQLVFFDNCVSRVAKKPVHYQDLLQSLSDDVSKTTSALVAAIVEQWPFVVKSGDASTETAVGAWIASLLGNLKQAGESTKVLKAARDALIEATETKKTKSLLKKSLKEADHADNEDKMDIDSGSNIPSSSNKASTVDLDEIFGFLPTEGTTHNALNKWEREDIEEAVDQGHVAELMLCLCSQHEEVRRQAFANIIRFMAKLKESTYAEWRTVFTLAGELLETVNNIGMEKPVPWIVGECASNCLAVLTDPLHKVYGKVNKFLQKAPSWEVEKIPTYWVDKILLHEPELDDGYFEEIDWLLNLFIRALRTEADMEVYRRANVFERILSLYQSPTLVPGARRKILQIVYRAAQVGGSTTLITRSGVISWIQIQAAEADAKEAAQLAALARALYEKCDRERVDAWSNGTLGRVVDEIQAQV